MLFLLSPHYPLLPVTLHLFPSLSSVSQISLICCCIMSFSPCTKPRWFNPQNGHQIQEPSVHKLQSLLFTSSLPFPLCGVIHAYAVLFLLPASPCLFSSLTFSMYASYYWFETFSSCGLSNCGWQLPACCTMLNIYIPNSRESNVSALNLNLSWEGKVSNSITISLKAQSNFCNTIFHSLSPMGTFTSPAQPESLQHTTVVICEVVDD